MDLDKRRKNVDEALNLFMSYFVYHGVFFVIFSVQNYYYYREN